MTSRDGIIGSDELTEAKQDVLQTVRLSEAIDAFEKVAQLGVELSEPQCFCVYIGDRVVRGSIVLMSMLRRRGFVVNTEPGIAFWLLEAACIVDGERSRWAMC